MCSSTVTAAVGFVLRNSAMLRVPAAGADVSSKQSTYQAPCHASQASQALENTRQRSAAMHQLLYSTCATAGQATLSNNCELMRLLDAPTSSSSCCMSIETLAQHVAAKIVYRNSAFSHMVHVLCADQPQDAMNGIELSINVFLVGTQFVRMRIGVCQMNGRAMRTDANHPAVLWSKRLQNMTI
jgi:hypothetical protein